LWVTDGTVQGTRLFQESCPGSCGDITALALVEDDLYWVAQAEVLGTKYELWRYDDAGLRAIATFPLRFPRGADPWIAPLAGGVAFAAADLVHGSQLWWAAGGNLPRMLTAIDTGTGHADPRRVLDLDGRAVFHACTGGSGTRALWSTSGGAADTVQLTADGSFRECGLAFETNALSKVGSLAFFVPGNDQQAPVLWRTDGSVEGTLALETLVAGSRLLELIAEHEGLAYFPQVQDDRFELWRSDGTTAGTFAAATVETPLIRQASGIVSLAGRLYFDGFVDQTNELWTSDGSSAGTVRLTAQGAPGAYLPPELTAVDGKVFFRAYREATGFELWQTDGTPAGTEPVVDLWPGPDGSFPSWLTALEDRLFFFADSSPQERGLWSTDGSADGTELVRAFPRGQALPPQPTTLGSRLLFAADDGVHGHELWSTDGTEAGTELMADIFAQAGSSFPDELTVAGDRVFFVAREPIHGRELWVTDGTTQGTKLVHDLMPGPGDSAPQGLTVVGSRLYFSADDGVHGRELWSLDFTATSTDCLPSDTGLCLQGNRFRVEIDWRDFHNNTGRATTLPLTADTGAFWFFNPQNIETIVKVLDGQAVDEHFWTFYGALSNVEYTMTLTDTAIGLTQRYFNPSNQFASVGDTESFGPNGASLASFRAPDERILEEHRPFELQAHCATRRNSSAKGLGCSAAPTRLCLNNGRFAVEARWTDFAGNSGTGKAVALTGDTGYFWFFREANIEVVLKVLDGRPVNGNFWVYYGALSNVAYTLTVTDTETGAVRTYSNPSGRFASVGDTGAFAVP
jgi:ELWxxDGT repeat protein